MEVIKSWTGHMPRKIGRDTDAESGKGSLNYSRATRYLLRFSYDGNSRLYTERSKKSGIECTFLAIE